MIAQVVFDLPIDGPFDYLIPEHMIPDVSVGTRVKVFFGPKAQIGFVIGIIEKSAIAKLKPVVSCFPGQVFNNLDFFFARDFSAYNGCSLGEALLTIFRNKEHHQPSIRREHQPKLVLYRCGPHFYNDKVQKIVDEYRQLYKDAAGDYCNFLILVPDSYRAQRLARQFREDKSVKIGTRSCVFECDGRYDCVMMIDDEDASYKQEQMPMYETRQVLLRRSEIFGFDIAFIGLSPSVELMELVRGQKVRLIEDQHSAVPAAKLIDLSNYKFIPGMLSPPLRDALESALKSGRKSVLVLNRRGSYRLTRCVDCAEVLKCSHCDSPLIYSRSQAKYLCRHCTFTAPGDTVCPKCHKPSWRSVGIGVEQLQTELKKQFPQAKIVAFERSTKGIIARSTAQRSETEKESLPDFDILISTSAVLRYQGTLQVQVAAFIDFDAELNRLDMRSAFNAFSLALHIGSMAQEPVFIQTRNSDHYVLQHLLRGKIQLFYDEELKLRKELGFSPFKHWIKIGWRGKSENLTQQSAQEAFKQLSQQAQEEYVTTPPLADVVGRKRDQFRINVMVQANQVPKAMAFIKSCLAKIKRRSKVIISINVDP